MKKYVIKKLIIIFALTLVAAALFFDGSFSFDKEKPVYSDDYISLYYLPEGFELDYVHTGKLGLIYDFVNDADEKTKVISITIDHVEAGIGLDTENGIMENITINGHEAYLIKNPKNINFVVWSDDYVINTIIGENISADEIIKIAENMHREFKEFDI